MSAGSSMSSPAAERREPGDVLVELGRRGRRARGASRRCRRRAGSRDRRRTGARRRPGSSRAVDPDVSGAASLDVAVAAQARPRRRRSASSGPRALATVSSHSAAGSLPQVMPPPTCSVSRRPSATNVRMRMLGLHRAVGPDPAERARVRAAADRLEPLEDLHRADLRRAGDRAAGERRGEQVEGVAAVGEDAGHRRDEVLDGGRPLEPAQARDPDAARAGRRGRGRCAGRRRSSRSRRGPWRSTSSSQASARSSAAVAAARARALDRVGRHDARRASTDRNGSGEADSSARGRPVSGLGPRSRYAEKSDGSPVRRRR